MVSELEYGRLTVSETFAEKQGRDENASRPLTYTEQFEDICPTYMAMGMTYEQFWDGDNEIATMYRKSYQIKQEMANRDMWVQGMYFYEALCDVAPILRAFSKARRPSPYTKEPYKFEPVEPIEQEQNEKEVQADKKAKTIMEMFMVGFNQKKQKSLNSKEKNDGG